MSVPLRFQMTPWSVIWPAIILAFGIAPIFVRPLPASPETMLLLATVAAGVTPLVVALAISRLIRGADMALLATAATLTAVGMSLQWTFAMAPGPDRDFYLSAATRHGFFIGAGFVALLAGALSARKAEAATRYPYTILLAALAMIAATVVFGDTVNGARLWLQAGPVRFQPSEVARLLLTVFLAAYLYDRRHLISSSWRVGRLDLPPAPYLIPVAGAVLSAVLVLILQSDLGMAALLVLGAFALVATALRSRLATSLASVVIAVAVGAAFMIVPRFQGRVAGWLDPWAKPFGGGFQFIQAEFALSSGRLVGSSAVAMSTRVPEVHTDFVLIGLGSEFGVLVAAAVLALSGVLVVRCAMNALRAGDGFSRLLALGLTTLLGFQVLLIGGGTLRLIPLTGVTFPLVSYGGTSMVVTLFSLGLILGLGARQPASFPSAAAVHAS